MRPTLRWFGVLMFFAALTAAHTWPLARDASTHMQPGADPKTMMWAQYDLARNLATDPMHLMDGSAFYPYGGTLAAVDHQIGNALLAVPMVLAGVSVVGTFNALFMATFLLSGLFTCVLVYRLTGSLVAGVFSGCAFAFSSARVYNLPHAHVLATQWVPLGLLGVHAYLERPSFRRWLGLFIGALLVATSSWHITIIGGIAMGVVALWLLAAGKRDMRRIGGLAVVALLCALALLPIADSYMQLARDWPPVREGEMPIENLTRSSVDVPAGLVALPKESRAPYAALLATNRPSLFPGLVTLLVALPAAWGLRRRAEGRPLPTSLRWVLRGSAALLVLTLLTAWAGATAFLAALRFLAPWALFALVAAAASLWRASVQDSESPDPAVAPVRAYAALATCGILLALGPRVMAGAADLGSGLWRLDLLPLPLLMRAPVRFSILLALGLAVLGGFAMASWQRSLLPRRAMLVAAAVLVVLNIDLAFAMPELAAVPPPTGADRWLAEEADEGAVIEFPLMGNYWAIHASQEYYDRRNVDGRGFMRPPAIRRLRARPDLSRQQVDLLWEYFRPRYVVVREGLYPPGELTRVREAIADLGEAVELRLRDGDDVVYELFDRGRGTRLIRRWPHAALLASGGFITMTGQLSEGREGTRGRLVVLMNGQVLREITEAELSLRPRQNLDFDTTDIVPGENSIELRADYVFAPDQPANAIGTSGTSVGADVAVSASLAGGSVEVNGVRTRQDASCWLAVLDPATGAVVDEYADGCVTDEQATSALEVFIERVPRGSPVTVVVAVGEQTAAWSRISTALASLGLNLSVEESPQAFAGLGVKGAPAGSVLEQQGGASATVTAGAMDRRRFSIRSLRLR